MAPILSLQTPIASKIPPPRASGIAGGPQAVCNPHPQASPIGIMDLDLAPPGGASDSILDLGICTPPISSTKYRKPHQKATFEQIEVRMERCGDSFKVHHHLPKKGGCDARVLAPIRCGVHWCPTCYGLWADQKRREIQAVVETYQWPMSVGLTVPSIHDLDQQHEGLIDSFRKLRRWDGWKDSVRAGVASEGLTHNHKGWHDHLHMIVDSEWIDIPALSAKWTEIVNARFGTDYPLINLEVERIDKRKIAAQVEHDIHGTKEDLGGLLAEFDRVPGLFREAVEAFQGKHWIIWFGDDRPPAKEKKPCICPRCGDVYHWPEWEGAEVSREVAEFNARAGPLCRDYYWGFGARDAPPRKQ